MLRRLWQRLRLRAEIRRDARSMEQHLHSIKRLVDEAVQTIATVNDDVDRLRDKMQSLEETQRKLEQENDRLRAELGIANEITIPGLVASHTLLVQRTEADTAIQVKRQVAGVQ